MTVEPSIAEPKAPWDAASAVNFLMVAFALLPVIPFLLIFWFARDIGSLPESGGDMIFSAAFILTSLGACGATFLLPVLIPLGWYLSHRRRARTGKVYRWWAYLLAGVLWLVFAGFLVYQLSLM